MPSLLRKTLTKSLTRRHFEAFSAIGRLVWLAGLMAIAFSSSDCRADVLMLAGAARKSIVPPFPTMMGGFNNRVQNFEGVHDEVFARALVLDNGSTKLVFITSDLRSVDMELTRLTREKIGQTTGIPAANILVCSTHNHSGPSYHQKSHLGQDDVEPSLKQFLLKRFVEVALEANQSVVPVRVGIGVGQIHGMTRNRQQKNDLIDPQVGVLRVEALEGRKTIATLFNFTGHPVVLGGSNLLLSAEYPGAACLAVENLVGGVALFTQGACGDITVNRSGESFQEIERLGRTLAGEVIKISGLIKLEEQLAFKSASKTLALPARRWPSVEEAVIALERGRSALESAKARNASAAAISLQEDKNRVLALAVMTAKTIADDPSRKETELKAEVQVIEVGNMVFGTIPGELLVEYALELRSRVQQVTGQLFCLVGYANGYVGYIVTPRAMETGGYEASVTRLNVDAGRTLTEALMELVVELSQ